MTRIREAGEWTCRHFASRGCSCGEPLLVLRDDCRRKRAAPVSMKANEEVLVKVERVPLAREEVLDERLVELKSVVMRLDRAVIFGDHAHRQVFVEVRARLSKSPEKRVGMVEVGEEGLGNEGVTPGEKESEAVGVGGRRVKESKQAWRLLIILRRTIRRGTARNDDERTGYRRRQKEEAELARVAQGNSTR